MIFSRFQKNGRILKRTAQRKRDVAGTACRIPECFGMTADPRLKAVAWTALGLAFGIMVVGLLFTSGILLKIKTTKQRLAGKK